MSLDRPIRVVMFGGGPVLEPDVQQFLVTLEAHPDIELLAAFCQSSAQTWTAVVQDLFKRRGLLAFPLLLIQILQGIGRLLRSANLKKQMAVLTNRIHYIPDIHTVEVLSQVQALQPDLGLIYGSPILKTSLFEIPTNGTLGIHHGKVPQYRGKKTAFWAMYNGEATAGVTIQKINAGLDTGEVVKAGEVPIGRRSYTAVWRDVLEMGIQLYLEAILAVKNGTATYSPQTGPKGKLYRDPKIKDLILFYKHHYLR